MSKKKRFGVSQALTRGLTETINVVENNAGIFRQVVLPLSRVELDPDNPRKLAISLHDVRHGLIREDAQYIQKQDELERLKDLSTTIKNSGVINPIVVYKRGEYYRVVAGERRCLASILAGKLDIEARVFNQKPKGFDLKLIQWVENTAREDLTLHERIGNIRDLLKEYQVEHPQTEVTATLLKNLTGLSLPQASYYLIVLNAPADVAQAIQEEKLRNLDKAALLANVEKAELRKDALLACINGASLKELRNLIATHTKSLKKNHTPHSQYKERLRTRVDMGSTLYPAVVRTLIESVISRADFEQHADLFAQINWSQYEQATRAFRRLVEILEIEMSDVTI